MKLANPYQQAPFNKVSQDRDGTDLYGYRNVDGQEEIVHLPSGQSNMNYYQPEKVINPEGCEHVFRMFDSGKREIECQHCRLLTSFHPAVNFREDNGKAFVIINYKEYEIVF